MNDGWEWDEEDDERIWTAYHEAGHCVIGVLMGARVRFASIEVEADDRFGEVEMEWPRGASIESQVLAILAGPVAEMTYRDGMFERETLAPSTSDFQQALRATHAFGWTNRKQIEWLNRLIAQLQQQFERSDYWSAVAAVSDQLLAHDTLEHDAIADEVLYWVRRPRNP